MSLTTDGAPPQIVRPAFAPGTVIAGRYRIEARLGAGGGGTVFRCVDQTLNLVVALKVIAPDADLERLRREVAMARQITHRNVCRVHDLGEAGDVRFVTMELVEGTSLRDKVRPDVPAHEARALIDQLVAGVAAIHGGGVVHRDLKPENVVVASDGRAVIVDFGLAKTPSSAASTMSMRSNLGGSPAVTHAGVAVGTPRYMSPEQAAGEPVDARTDVWSLGLVAHELLTGAMPELDVDVGGPAVSPVVEQRWPGFGAILRACLAVDPSSRFTDASTLGAAIAQGANTPIEAAGPVGLATWRASTPAIDNVTMADRPSSLARDAHALHASSDLARHAPHAPNDPNAAPLVPSPAKPGGRRWPYVVAAIGASAVIGFFVVRAVRSNSATGGSGEGGSNALGSGERPRTVASTKMQQLTSTSDVQWPDVAPTSVALDPTGTKLAYTTGHGKLFVRELSGGAPVERIVSITTRDRGQALGSPRVVGWFSDGSIALLGSTTAATQLQLIRLRPDDSIESLHQSTSRFRAAVTAKGDKVAIAQQTTIVERGGGTLVDIPRHDHAVALAWSADGTQLAWMRVTPAGDAVLSLGTTELWRGKSEILVDPLLAFTGDRIAFSSREKGRTTIARIDPATKKVDVFEELSGDVGSGSVVNGTLVLVRGPTREIVQIRDRFALKPLPAHADSARGTHVAGWTTKGAAVFRLDDRVVRSTSAGKAWQVDNWPGTQTTDIPVATLGDDVLVRRDDGDAWLVERVTDTGTRSKVGRFERAIALRCVTDKCVLQQRDGDQATWSELDPATGTVGNKITQREIVARVPSFALTHDGTKLAIADGTENIRVLDRATGSDAATVPNATILTRWGDIAFDVEGDLWATAVELDAHPFAIARLKGGSSFIRPSNQNAKPADALRWFYGAAVHGSDRDLRVAVATKELHLEIWRADGF